ncbi:MAG: trypsin-like peptidase domain-containing protein [Planctomycetes bacterium]|nr:trypsin-like peptidase domain-containing protein [Planctomycetota bacterium]
MRSLALLVGMCVFGVVAPPSVFADPAESVVKITAFTRFPDPNRPWEKPRPKEGSGSGVYIGGNRILTNAHVVTFASEVYVQWNPTDEKTDAKLFAISVDLDLALITVADEKFFNKRKPLPMSVQIPKLKDAVAAYGFPIGGAGLSVTKGEVSRINSVRFGSEGHGLQIQTSAALNPGNSGGPAVSGDKMIGLVYRGILTAQNIGYIIPAEEVDFFLKNIKDGRFTGKPRLNTLTKYQPLENEALRRAIGIDKAVTGILIFGATPDVPLKDMDIITKIGEHAVDNRGNIQLGDGVSAFFTYAVPKVLKNGVIPVTVRRDGKPVTLQLKADHMDRSLIRSYGNEPLPYFLHGPLVFVPARQEDVNDFFARKNIYAHESPLTIRRADYIRFPGEELVVISAQFRHKVANGYHDHSGQVLKSVNGVTIKNMRHLVETVRDDREKFLKFAFAEESSESMVFDRVEMENATEQLIEELGIAPTRRGSPELMEAWRGKKKTP